VNTLRQAEQEAGPGEPAAPPETGAGGWRRLDPRMLFVHPVRELARLFPVLLGAVFAGSSTGQGGLWGLLGAGIAIGLGVMRWFTTGYRIAGGVIQVRRGLFRRQVLTVSLDRVRTVDITASALHRVLGLVRMTVGTGLSDRSGHDALRLDGLSVADAERLRDDLLHHRPDKADGDRADKEEAATPASEEVLASIHPSWIWYGPFTLSGFVTVFVVLGFAWRIVSEARIDLRRLRAVTQATSVLEETSRVVVVTLAVLALAVVVAIASTLGYVMAFWGFRLVRNSDGALVITRGLVSTRATTIEERRLRGVELSEPLLLRAVSGARCIAIATGLRVGRGAERGGSLLLPPAPLGEARRVAAEVLRSSEPVDSPLVTHGPAARRRRYTRALLVWALPVVLLFLLDRVVPLPSWVWAVMALLLMAAAGLAFDRYRSLGHALAGGTLVTRVGSLVRRRSMLGVDGIIGWNLRRSFFQRRAGLATLVATTAAGRQHYSVEDVPLGEAISVAEQALPDLLAPFLVRAGGPAEAS
jgi:putative membrane protein